MAMISSLCYSGARLRLLHGVRYTDRLYPVTSISRSYSSLIVLGQTIKVEMCPFNVPRFFLDRETTFFGKTANSELVKVELEKNIKLREASEAKKKEEMLIKEM